MMMFKPKSVVPTADDDGNILGVVKDATTRTAKDPAETATSTTTTTATSTDSESTTTNSSSSVNDDDDNDDDDSSSQMNNSGTMTTPTAETELTSERNLRKRRGTGNNSIITSDKTSSTSTNTRHTAATTAAKARTTIKNDFTVLRWFEFGIGTTIFVAALPMVIFQIVTCTVWEWIDQHTIKLVQLATQINTLLSPYQTWLVNHPKDTFVVNTTIWLGVVLPTYFVIEAIAQTSSQNDNGNEFIWWRAILYNVIRIGPMYRHFMYVYTLCHKEAHLNGKLFRTSSSSSTSLYIYNYWIGLFHGVLPGPFTESHVYNHHKYDNGQQDVYSTGAYPRDSVRNFLRYIYIWFCYALNISTMIQFYKEGNKIRRMINTILGTTYYISIVTLTWYYCGGLFCSVYLLYPLVEGNILLAAVNYTWHAFIDPNDHENEYVNSVTILDGLNFTLAEEYHVVHHQYAGMHWSRHEEMYEKHLEEYIKCTATVFEKCNLFVIWGMVVAKDYDGLTNHYVQLHPDKSKHLTKGELAELLKSRLQCTTWSY